MTSDSPTDLTSSKPCSIPAVKFAVDEAPPSRRSLLHPDSARPRAKSEASLPSESSARRSIASAPGIVTAATRWSETTTDTPGQTTTRISYLSQPVFSLSNLLVVRAPQIALGSTIFNVIRKRTPIRTQLTRSNEIVDPQQVLKVSPSETTRPLKIHVCSWNVEYSDPALEDLLLPENRQRNASLVPSTPKSIHVG